MSQDWKKEFKAAITVCDLQGTIIEMNEKAQKTFEKYGGALLLGKNLWDCHPPKAQEKIKELLKTQKTNAYTIEKAGIKKLIYQAPWYDRGECQGLVEISLEIPADMPHFVRPS